MMGSSTAAPVTAGGYDLNTLLQLEIVRLLADRPASDGPYDLLECGFVGGSRSVERSLRALRQLKREIHTRPKAVVRDFLAKVLEQLAAQPDQMWSPRNWNRRLAYGRHKTLRRGHVMLAETFTTFDESKTLECQTLLAPYVNAALQGCLDDGSRYRGGHSTGLVEPTGRARPGGSEHPLEAVAAYTRAVEDLEQRMLKARHSELAAVTDETPSSVPKAKTEANFPEALAQAESSQPK